MRKKTLGKTDKQKQTGEGKQILQKFTTMKGSDTKDCSEGGKRKGDEARGGAERESEFGLT